LAAAESGFALGYQPARAALAYTSLHNRQEQGDLKAFKPHPAYQGLLSTGYGAGLVVLALGALCLLADLGRIDRVLLLFTHPTSSLLSLGTYALTILLLVAAVLTTVWSFNMHIARRWIISVLRIIVLVFSVLVMLYTGFLFQSMGVGLLIGSLLIPILFVLSSLSTGCAILLIMFSLARRAQGFLNTCRQLLRVDCLVIALELIATGALMAQALLTPDYAQTVEAVTQQPEGLVFWLGFLVCGLAVPFIFESIQWRGQKNLSQRSGTYLSYVGMAALVLIGGYSLRWCVAVLGLPVFVSSAM